MSTLEDLQHAQKILGSGLAGSLFGMIVLVEYVQQAMKPPAPAGSPDAINEAAKWYSDAATQTQTVGADLAKVAGDALPASWRGQVAETAAQAVQGVSAEVRNTAAVLTRASNALQRWAADLDRAQASDAGGLGILSDVAAYLHGLGFTMSTSAIQAAQQQALAGVGLRVAAAQLAQSSGTRTASLLDQLAQQARAERMRSKDLDALTSVVEANATTPNGQDILSSGAMQRASQRLAALSPQDRAAFEALLAGAKSPSEAAYLLKALAAGHDLSQLRQFDAAIHAHGDDPNWLAMHLVPDVSSDGSTTGQHYFGRYGGDRHSDLDVKGWDIYNQGNPGDCVAASTIIGQANVDPTVMLALTTGGTADGDDSPDAFYQRLQAMYVDQYRQGQQADGTLLLYPHTDKGLGSKGEDRLADQDLGASTGTSYHYAGLDGSDDRQSAIPQIERAVDAGNPVPLDLTSGSGEGHQVMIIGRDGDKLEIYNPWGYTTWVTESQFVDGDLGVLTTDGSDGSLKTPYGLELPDS